MAKDTIIFDLDGTLSLIGDKYKYLTQKPIDWRGFQEACKAEGGCEDANIPVCKLYEMLSIVAVRYPHDLEIKILTARKESQRPNTIQWLIDNKLMLLDDNDILMVPDDDDREDIYTKPDLIKEIKDRILCIFEDRTCMADKWRELGYCCLQVADNDY